MNGVRGSLVTAAIMLGAMGWPQSATAQRPTSAIIGQVVDLTGAALPGASISLASDALILPSLTLTTDSRGEFRFFNLEPGVYEVRATSAGFTTAIRSDVHAATGSTVRLTFELQPRADVTVNVTGEIPTVDVVTSTNATVFPQELLQGIPNDRYFGSVFNYAPGVSDDSAHGSSVRGNSYRLDGVDITDPVVGTPFVFFNYDIFDQVQVQTGGRTAEYGQATGAVVNLVTKSGGNQFGGSGSFFFGGHGLTAANGKAITARFPALKPGKYLELLDGQGQVGGPIERNRVWFFASLRGTSSDFTVPGFNEPASTEPVVVPWRWTYTYGKVSAQLTPNHRVIGGVNINHFTDENRNANAFTLPESTSREQSGALTTNLEWSGTFRSRLLVQTRYTGVDEHFDERAKNGAPMCYNQTTGVAGCSSGQNDLNRRDRHQLQAVATRYGRFRGLHDAKVGGEYERSGNWRDLRFNDGLQYNVMDTAQARAVPWSVWTLQSSPTKEAINRFSLFGQDRWNLSRHLTINIGLRVDRSEGGLPEQRLSNGDIAPERSGLISQTDLSPRVGIAYDPTGTGSSVVRASYARYTSGLITAYFYEVNQNALAGQLHADCTGPLVSNCRAGDGRFSSAVFSSFGPSTTKIDDDLALPKADEAIVGYEVQIRPAMSVAVNYTYKKEFDLINDVETVRAFVARTAFAPAETEYDETGRTVDSIGVQRFTIYDPDLNTGTQLVITNPSGADRRSRSLDLIANTRFADKWMVHGSLVVSRSSGLVGTSFFNSTGSTSLFDTPNALINAQGRLDLNRTVVFKLLGTYRLPRAIEVSGYYRVLSGAPYTRTALFSQYDANGDGTNETALTGPAFVINAEPRGARTLDTIQLTDFGLEKIFAAAQRRLGLRADVYNLFNVDTVTGKLTRTTSAGKFGEPHSFIGGRGLRLSANFKF